jgi:hypothetical protein
MLFFAKYFRWVNLVKVIAIRMATNCENILENVNRPENILNENVNRIETS